MRVANQLLTSIAELVGEPLAESSPGGERVRMPHRRGIPARWWSVALPLVLMLTAMSGDTPESRRVADRFLVLYYDYDMSRVREAAKLCTGDAKMQVEAEIKFMDGADPDGEEHPPAAFGLVYHHASTDSEATYVYRVHIRTPDTPALFAKLVLVKENGQWFVNKFLEKERAS